MFFCLFVVLSRLIEFVDSTETYDMVKCNRIRMFFMRYVCLIRKSKTPGKQEICFVKIDFFMVSNMIDVKKQH